VEASRLPLLEKARGADQARPQGHGDRPGERAPDVHPVVRSGGGGIGHGERSPGRRVSQVAHGVAVIEISGEHRPFRGAPDAQHTGVARLLGAQTVTGEQPIALRAELEAAQTLPGVQRLHLRTADYVVKSDLVRIAHGQLLAALIPRQTGDRLLLEAGQARGAGHILGRDDRQPGGKRRARQRQEQRRRCGGDRGVAVGVGVAVEVAVGRGVRVGRTAGGAVSVGVEVGVGVAVGRGAGNAQAPRLTVTMASRRVEILGLTSIIIGGHLHGGPAHHVLTSFATVTPSPPSFSPPGSKDLTCGCWPRAWRTSWRSLPVPLPWMMRTNGSPAK